MALFKRVRDERVDHLSTETNKLIIRLDKLLTKLPTDPVKRKGTLARQSRALPGDLFPSVAQLTER